MLWVLIILGFISGVIINILSDDLPQRHGPRLPHYPDGTPRPFIAWSGITAYLTGQHTSPNGSKLSWRHPATEIVTITLFILTASRIFDIPTVTTYQSILLLIHMAIFVLITVIDLEHRLILFIVIIPAWIIALIDAATTQGYGPDLGQALIGGAVGFAIFFLLYLGGFLFTNILSRVQGRQITEVAFGYGDVMLITLSGFLLGWQTLVFTMFITVFLGAAGAILYLVARRITGRHTSLFTPLPYGQYIIIATIIMMLYASNVANMIRGA